MFVQRPMLTNAFRSLAPFAVGLALMTSAAACASTPEPEPEPASNDDDRPGPMRPLGPDLALDAAPPQNIEDQRETELWLAERVANAKAGKRERVRLPVVRRSESFGCDCPPYAVAPTPENGPFYWIAIVDLTSAGIPPGEWRGWVDGRFTGAMHTYRSTDDGGRDVVTPTFEVLRQRTRTGDEAPEARVVAE